MDSTTQNSTLYATLLITVSLIFISTLLLYALVSSGNPVNRIRFAVFISVFPAALTLMIIKLMRLPETWWRVVLIYVVVFIATVIVQSVMR